MIETIHRPAVLRQALSRLDQAALLAATSAGGLDQGPDGTAIRLTAMLADADRPMVAGPVSAAINLLWQVRTPTSVSERTLRARLAATLGPDGSLADLAISTDLATARARTLIAA